MGVERNNPVEREDWMTQKREAYWSKVLAYVGQDGITCRAALGAGQVTHRMWSMQGDHFLMVFSSGFEFLRGIGS